MPLVFSENTQYDKRTGNPVDLDLADTISDPAIPKDICLLVWRLIEPHDFESLILRHGREAESKNGETTGEILKVECAKCRAIPLYATSEKWEVLSKKYGRNLTSGPIRKDDGSILCPEE